LLGVDQSVLLLKSGNDVDKSKVLEEIKKYDKVGHSSHESRMFLYRIRNEGFVAANAVLLTNNTRINLSKHN